LGLNIQNIVQIPSQENSLNMEQNEKQAILRQKYYITTFKKENKSGWE